MTALVHAFSDTAPFATALARELGLSLARVAVHRFPDGESLARIRPPACRHAILVRSLPDPNAKLVETLLAADALRRAGAARVTLVAPYLPYMRQDSRFRAGEPVSQVVVCSLLARAFDAVVTVEPHLHRVTRLASVLRSGHAVSAAPAIAAWLRGHDAGTVLVGPDAESAAWVRTIANAAALPYVVAAKTRHGDRRVRIRLPALPDCRRAVLVDDIASTGGTLAAAARALAARGVRRVDAVVVHAVFADGARARLRAAGIRTIASCDTIAHPTNVIPVAPLVAAALRARSRPHG